MKLPCVLSFFIVAVAYAGNPNRKRNYRLTYPASTLPLDNKIITDYTEDILRNEQDDKNAEKTAIEMIPSNKFDNDEEIESTSLTLEGYYVEENVKEYDETTIESNMEMVDESPTPSTLEKYINETHEKRNEKALIGQFPFHHVHSHSNHHVPSHSNHLDRRRNKISNNKENEMDLTRDSSPLQQLSSVVPDSSGRRCINKVMMREETEYDEILTCDHSYDKRCHTSYVTKYEPHQEQECDEKFRKVCTIEYEQKALHELVEVCVTPFIKDCEIEGEEICSTVYESECSTVQIVHEVEDDVPNCVTEEETRCDKVVEGLTTVEKCDTWPVERCTVEKKPVKKYTPKTSCNKVPRELCAPKGCGLKEGTVQCQDKVKTVVVDNPIEQCDMEPLRTCKHVTKLVPSLKPTQECVDVPKEICARSKVNPRKVKKPSIQKWCFTPKDGTDDSKCEKDEDCKEPGYICEAGQCLLGCTDDEDCQNGFSCVSRKCRAAAGKVLLGSINIKTLSCTNCSPEDEGVLLTLRGERLTEYTDGFPCQTSVQFPLNKKDSQDFQTGEIAKFDGSTRDQQQMMGDCFKAPLNNKVRGGKLTWLGKGQWTPDSVCIDWLSSNFAYKCKVANDPSNENMFNLIDCESDFPNEKCSL